MLEVNKVKYISKFTLWLSFNDGTEGAIDLEGALWGPAFEPLKQNISAFKKVAISPILGTISWPNDTDFAPEFLKSTLIAQRNNEAKT